MIINNQKGVTLISLVITIIVLMILSAVTIEVAFDKKGIIKSAEEFSNSMENTENEKNEELDVLLQQLEDAMNSDKNSIEILLTTSISWANEKATLTLGTTISGYNIYYKTGEGEYIEYATPITDLNHGNAVDVKLTKEGQVDKKTTVNIIDGNLPSATITLGANSAKTGETITATVTHTDNESGVNTTNCKYIYNQISTNLGTTSSAWNSATSFSSNTETINLTADAEGTYYVHVLTIDKAENKKETISNAITIEAQVTVTGVWLNKETETMTIGETLTLTATIEPENATNKNITWDSSNKTVATISDNGYITAIKAGTTTITATTADGSFTATCEVTVKEPTVADYMAEAVESNTYTQDKYGNKVVIPAGFKVLANGTQGVVYNYDQENETSTGEPVVQDGIVIQHEEDENEFVWVPVGTINNDVDGASTTNLKLGRYSTWTMTTSTTPPTPPSPKQEASKTAFDSVVGITDTNWLGQTVTFFENTTGTYNGTTYGGAKFATLGTWISNTIDNGGYYIARYEASYGVDGKANSKPSTGTPSDSAGSAPTAEGMLWNFVAQPAASTASKAMYPTSENLGYYSELVNSYAWDTAIIFIQTYSGKTTYSSQSSIYRDGSSPYQPANTGERGATASIAPNTTDKVCNIYDISSNIMELTTETAVGSLVVGFRGGEHSGDQVAKYRAQTGTANPSYFVGFRALLDCNAES